jgi:hypothetical protein
MLLRRDEPVNRLAANEREANHDERATEGDSLTH